MPGYISDEDALEALEAFQRASSIQDAAAELGIQWHTCKRRVIAAEERNLGGSLLGGRIPSGQMVKGVSTFYGPDGSVRGQWVKTDRDGSALETTFEAIRDALRDIPPLPNIAGPETTNADLVTVYPIADHHLGLYAWKPEAGADYDLQIGVDLLRNSVADLSRAAPSSQHAFVVSLGDFFHMDNSLNRTLRSNHALDADGRWSKVLRAGVHLFLDCIRLALAKHETVTVRVLPGNHDDHSTAMLSIAAELAFADNPRVNVDISPARIFCHRFGSVLVAGAHGDMAKPADMPGVIAATFAEEWGRSKHRHCLTGHIHHQTKIEKHGCIVESMSTLAAKDAYSAGMGYSSQRSICAITYHKDRGEYIRNTVAAL